MPALVDPVDPVDFVALCLLPVNWWRDIAAALRAGALPRDTLERFVVERPADPPRSSSLIRRRAAAVLDRARALQIDAIPWDDPAYPPALAAIVDPPLVLWVRGHRSALDAPAVSIVGSRAGSPYAVSVAEQLAADLAGRGVVVISGLARGVDSAAHRGALSAGGTTIGVLGSGADVIYPNEHKSLADDMMASGAIVSELIPGTPPLRPFFPRRNRIISGLARAVVVIEAGEKSGSLITARCALEQGRDVLAVPGNVLSGRNKGGHALLRDGAKIVESADDILDELGFAPAGSTRSGPRGAEERPEQADPILRHLAPGECCDLDELVERTGLLSPRLLPRLLDLELRGLVRRAGGGRFVRLDRTC